MLRTLEPEIMDDREQSLAYANADFSSSNQWFVDHLLADYPDALRHVIDIGCGPGDVITYSLIDRLRLKRRPCSS